MIDQFPNRARPIFRCSLCLYHIGFGYDRIASLIRLRKKSVAAYLGLRKRQNALPSRTPLPTKNVIHSALRKTAALKSAQLKLQRTIQLKRLRKVKIYLRTKVWRWLFKNEHPRSAAKLVGCSKPNFRAHISSQFQRGMSWENYAAVWELDHIIPCKHFNLYDPIERAKCFHFSNYRPSFVSANRRKCSKISPCQPELLITNFLDPAHRFQT